MIRKFLVCGKQQMYMQSKNLDSYREIGKVIELLMPVKSYWVITEELKLANYQMSAGESPAEVMVTYRKIFGLCANWAVLEMDRTWLYENAARDG